METSGSGLLTEVFFRNNFEKGDGTSFFLFFPNVDVSLREGLRGGPLERLRESARENNFGKGTKAERARNVLRELVGVGEEEKEEKK